MSASAQFIVVGIIVSVFGFVNAGMNRMRRALTKSWDSEDPIDRSYGATFRRSLYKASRTKALTYLTWVLFVSGFGLIVAGIVEFLMK